MLLDYGAENDSNNLKQTPSDVASDAHIRELISRRTQSDTIIKDRDDELVLPTVTTELPSAELEKKTEHQSTWMSTDFRSGIHHWGGNELQKEAHTPQNCK